jgi:hypothetical protein
MNPWRKLVLFTFVVLIPAIVVGISNLHVFPDSSLSATLMLIVTVGVAAIFTWQSGAATKRVARYCIIADIIICVILCINLGGHWLLAREISAAKQGVEERHAEEDRELQRKKAETELDIARKKADADLKKADADLQLASARAADAERKRLAKLPIWQRRERLAPRAPLSPQAAKAEAAPSPEPAAAPEVPGVKAALAPRLTPEQVREKWWWFLTALAFAECFASILAGAVLAGVWEWDRDHDDIPDHLQRQIAQKSSAGNAQQKTLQQTVGQTIGHFDGQIPITASADNESQGNAQRNTQRNTRRNAQQESVGKRKSLGKSGNAQQVPAARTEWFRYEIDFRDREKGGYHVIVRRRLKWSDKRYAPTIAYRFCPDLTERMVKSIRNGKFTPAAVAALQNGGIGYEIIEKLVERIGKGKGKRATELTDHERSILARIESGLAAGGGRRNARAGSERLDMDVSHLDVPHSSDGEFTEVPNVH